MVKNKPLLRSTPIKEKVSAKLILKMLEEAEEKNIMLNSIMIIRNGKVITEGYYKPYSECIERSMHSATKSFTATAIGLLIDEGRLKLEDTVMSFFPEYAPENPCDNLKKMNVWHLLTMTCGHDSVPPRKGTDNYVKQFLNHPVPYVPGTHFQYSSMASYMLTAIIRKVTGQNMTRYLRTRIFEPLGIYDAYCDTCPMGIEYGGGGLFLRTEDLAKLAVLYLNNGIWNGVRLLSESWVKEFTKMQFRDSWSHSNPTLKPDWYCGYGFQNWRCTQKNAYRFDGSFGQLAVVLEDYNAVLVTTASEARPERILELFWKYLIPAFDRESTDTEWVALKKKLKNLKLPWPEKRPVSSKAREVSGREIIMDSNRESMVTTKRQSLAFADARIELNRTGIEKISLSFENDDKCRMRYTEDHQENEIVLGLKDKMEPGILKSIWGDYPVLSTGRWLNSEKFEVRILTITADYCTIVTFDFLDPEIKIQFEETPYDPVKQIPKGRHYNAKFMIKTE